MNATVALHVPPARIVEHCDSVSLCFSKVGKPRAASQTQDSGGVHSRSQLGSKLRSWQQLALGPLSPSPDGAPSPSHAPPLATRTEMHTWGAGRQDSLLSSSQGLGAPVGALVGGPKNFIEEAWRLRKALGGGMRQAGVLAAAALVGLADFEEVLQRDHQNAQRFAKGTWTTAPTPTLTSFCSQKSVWGSPAAGPKSPAGVLPSDSRTCRAATEP